MPATGSADHNPLPADTGRRMAVAALFIVFEGAAQPHHFIWLQGHHVEAAGRFGAMPMLAGQARQKKMGGMAQAALFGRTDAGGGTAVPAGAARPDFDEDQHVAITHDQIDFAHGAMQVASEQLQALCHQHGERLRFTPVTGALGWGALSRGGGCGVVRGGGHVLAAPAPLAMLHAAGQQKRRIG